MKLKTKIVQPTETTNSKIVRMLEQVKEVLKSHSKYKRMVEAKRALKEVGIFYYESTWPVTKFSFVFGSPNQVEATIYPRDAAWSNPSEILTLIEQEIPRYYETDEASGPSLWKCKGEIANHFNQEMTLDKFNNSKLAYAQALRQLAAELELAEPEQ